MVYLWPPKLHTFQERIPNSTFPLKVQTELSNSLTYPPTDSGFRMRPESSPRVENGIQGTCRSTPT